MIYCMPLLLLVALRGPLHLSFGVQVGLALLASSLPAYGFLRHRAGLRLSNT